MFTLVYVNDLRVQASSAALCTSGTAVLELQLSRLPCIVAYRAHLLTEWIMRLKTKMRFISLPNILMDSPIIPEALFSSCNPMELSMLLRYNCQILLLNF